MRRQEVYCGVGGRVCHLVLDAALNEHVVERIPNQNMVMGRPYTSPFETNLVPLKSYVSHLFNGTKIVENEGG